MAREEAAADGPPTQAEVPSQQHGEGTIKRRTRAAERSRVNEGRMIGLMAVEKSRDTTSSVSRQRRIMTKYNYEVVITGTVSRKLALERIVCVRTGYIDVQTL